MSRRRRPGRVATLVATLVALLAWLPAAPADAHNRLVSSSPEADSTVPRVPSRIVLTFDEPAIALGTQIVVTGPDGPVQAGAPQLVDTTVSQDLGPSPAGDYRVEWKVTSADGHPISGRFGFRAGAAGGGTATPEPATPPVAATRTPGWVPVGLAAVAALVVVVVLALRRRGG